MAVDFPLEDGVVFDIETLVPEGHCPTMATAASTEAWLDLMKSSIEPELSWNI